MPQAGRKEEQPQVAFKRRLASEFLEEAARAGLNFDARSAESDFGGVGTHIQFRFGKRSGGARIVELTIYCTASLPEHFGQSIYRFQITDKDSDRAARIKRAVARVKRIDDMAMEQRRDNQRAAERTRANEALVRDAVKTNLKEFNVDEGYASSFVRKRRGEGVADYSVRLKPTISCGDEGREEPQVFFRVEISDGLSAPEVLEVVRLVDRLKLERELKRR